MANSVIQGASTGRRVAIAASGAINRANGIGVFYGVTAVPVTITMPNPATVSAGWWCVIKDETGTANAGLNRIDIDPHAAGPTFDGAANADIITPYASRTIYTNGTNWFLA